MQIPTQTFEQLKSAKEIILENYSFEPSVRGFLVNVYRSLLEGIITNEQRDFLVMGIHF